METHPAAIFRRHMKTMKRGIVLGQEFDEMATVQFAKPRTPWHPERSIF